MKIITLTTDFGLKDYEVPALKGKLYSLVPNVLLADISHEIEPYNLWQAAYVLHGAFRHFPEGTIHIMGVQNDIFQGQGLLLFSYRKHYFICADNGFVSLFCEDLSQAKVYRVQRNFPESNFPTLDFSTELAKELAQGTALSKLGKPFSDYKKIYKHKPIAKPNLLQGQVIYLDSYGNLVTNLTKEFLYEHCQGKIFDLRVGYVSFKDCTLESIFSQYTGWKRFLDLEDFYNEKLLLFNYLGFLEIALYRNAPQSTGSASSLLGISKGENVTLRFIQTDAK